MVILFFTLFFAGGLIFCDRGSYSDPSGWRYLEVAPSDCLEAQWYNHILSYTTTGATGTAIGTGLSNTEDIVLAQGSAVTTAASACYDLTIGTYSDWFLPSKDELNLMYTNLYLQGSDTFDYHHFNWTIFWSSSESGSILSWKQDFSDGAQLEENKNQTCRIRAIRAFREKTGTEQ